MVHKILFWSSFGLGVRFWQLGLEMRPFFTRDTMWAYPIFAGVGGAFGYWLQGVEERQFQILTDRRDSLLEKRRRRAEREREGGAVEGSEGLLGTDRQLLEESVLASSTAVVPQGQPRNP
ncbi:MAG: hypothetical protein Q9165_005364 [Trypethelium subeluteriae]